MRGIWLVDLVPVSAGDDVGRAIAESVGVQRRPGEAWEETVVEALAVRDLLLVVDNCEHVIQAVAGLLGALLRRAPSVRVIATSRTRLGVSGEHVLPLRGMENATDLFSDWACDYLKTRNGASKPFFLYLAYNAPHTPIQPPAEWLQRVRDREPEMSLVRAKLVALIEHMDDGIGKVLRTLKSQGLDEDTIVMFTSDNGGQLNVGANNGFLRDGKQSMYEGGLKESVVRSDVQLSTVV